jgi:hypothetical protein
MICRVRVRNLFLIIFVIAHDFMFISSMVVGSVRVVSGWQNECHMGIHWKYKFLVSNPEGTLNQKLLKWRSTF